MKLSTVKEKALMIGLIAIIITMFLFWAIGSLQENILYSTFYKPLYFTFSEYLYFPFWLYVGSMLLLSGILGVVAFTLYRESRQTEKKSYKIGYIIFLIMAGIILVFIGRDTYNDLMIIDKNPYLITECKIGSLHRTVSGRTRIRHYYLNTINNTEHHRVNIDLYQYKELLGLQNQLQDDEHIIKIYYLPNTKRMLKYEY